MNIPHSCAKPSVCSSDTVFQIKHATKPLNRTMHQWKKVTSDTGMTSDLWHRNDKRTISWSALTQNLSTKLHYQYIINTLWPSNTIWRHTSGLPLAQVNCNGLLPYSTKLLLKPMSSMTATITYRKTSDISRTLVGNKIVDNSDVVGASPVGAAPTTSSFST